jgi:hypothetical protein
MRRAIAVMLLMMAMVASPRPAEARPGGGETYASGSDSDTRSGPGRGFGGSRYDSDGDDFNVVAQLIALAVRLLIRYPIIGLLALAVFFAYAGMLAWDKRESAAWDSMNLASTASAVADRPQVLDDIKTLDPDFSAILFEDFVFRLYATAHGVRADARKLDELAPYLSASVRRALAAREPVGDPVSNVVVGALRVYRVNVPTVIDDSNRDTAVVKVSVEFEANYSTAAGRHFVVETWTLQRSVTARTRPPDALGDSPVPTAGRRGARLTPRRHRNASRVVRSSTTAASTGKWSTCGSAARATTWPN